MGQPAIFSDFPLGIIHLSIGNSNIVGVIDTSLSLIDDEVRKLIPLGAKRYVCFSLPQVNFDKTGVVFTIDKTGVKATSYDTYDEALSGNYKSYASIDAKIDTAKNVKVGKLDTKIII